MTDRSTSRYLRAALISLAHLAAALSIQAQTTGRLTESLDVTILNVDVVVTDVRGRRVTGLTAEDFAVFSGRGRHVITNFSEYRAPKPSATASPAQPDRERRILLIILDHEFLPPRERQSLYTALRKVLQSVLGIGDRASIVSLSPRLMPLVPLTDNRVEILARLATIEQDLTSRASRSEVLQDSAREMFFEELRSFHEATGVNSTIVDDFASAERAARQIVGSKRRAFTLRSLFDRYGALPGKKAAILVSSFFHPGLHRAHIENTYTWIDEIGQSASTNGFTLYVLHPEGLASTMPDASVRRVQDPKATSQIFLETYQRALKEQEGLRLLTEPSGGTYFFGPAAITGSAEEVQDDFESYYSLGFRPIGRVDPGKNFRITVRNRLLRVRARRAFTAPTIFQRAERRALANLYDPITESEIAVHVSAGTLSPSRKGRILPVEISFLCDALLEKDDQRRFSVFVTAADSRGGVSKVVHKRQAFRASEENIGPIVRYNVDLLLRRGTHVISVSVLDEISARAGFARTIVH